ncbi:LUD domain-containing protein [Paenibacillus sp. J2TS4]|uniref:LutC/YkgG family protein n=1 Tax=Paenibacillus sp. J2TS4 TaxID=2807194 RepID=UPI001B2B3B12|nr:LUD domain-containing protein [Paenibacillus sp. J2TS4]GIP35261.1 lactate utilization protein C [Paenibacillus sp. J2TS4]
MSQAGTMTGRDEFMRRIAGRLGRTEPLSTAPQRTSQGVPEFYGDLRLNKEEKLQMFIRNWTALTGKVWVVPREEAQSGIRQCLQEVLVEQGVTKVSRWDHPQLNRLELDSWLAEEGVKVVPWSGDQPANGGTDPAHEWKPATHASGPNWAQRSALLRQTEQCQLGMVWPEYAVANSGTLVLLSQGGSGRSVSLLTNILFAVFHADQLVSRMGEAFAGIREAYPGMKDLPSSINLITGPSRSADIENDLTIGIHGPGKVCAVILE